MLFSDLSVEVPVGIRTSSPPYSLGTIQVIESWRAMLRNVRPGAFKLKLEDVRVFAREDMGLVTCVEVIDTDDAIGRCVGIIKGRWMGPALPLFEHGIAIFLDTFCELFLARATSFPQ